MKTAIAVIDLSFAFMAIPTLISSVWLAPKVVEKAKDYFASLCCASSCMSTGCEGVGQDCARRFSACVTKTTSARRSQVSNLDSIREENFGRGRSLRAALDSRVELNR